MFIDSELDNDGNVGSSVITVRSFDVITVAISADLQRSRRCGFFCIRIYYRYFSFSLMLGIASGLLTGPKLPG